MKIPNQSTSLRSNSFSTPVHTGIVPSIGKKCGQCTEIKWPNGTGTGARVKNCCEWVIQNKKLEQKCWTETCGVQIDHYRWIFARI